MSWRRWKLGIVVAVGLSLLVAGAALEAGTSWRVFLQVFCVACLTHLGAFLKDHPPEAISFETELTTKEPDNTKGTK